MSSYDFTHWGGTSRLDNIEHDIDTLKSAGATQKILSPSGDTSGSSDTAAISAAFSSFDRVLLIAGDWYISGLTVTSSSKWLSGFGPATVVNGVPGSTTLTLSGVSNFFLSDMFFKGGDTAIDVQGAADSRFWNLFIEDQTAGGVLINGDDSTEQHWSDVVLKNVGGVAFDYARTTNSDMGGMYLDRVRIIQAGSGATYAYRFKSTSVSAPNINLFMSECVGDNYPGDSLYIENCDAGVISTSWFTSSSSAASGAGCIHLHGSVGYSFNGCHTVQASSSGSAYEILLDNSSAQVVINGHTFAGSSNTALGVNGAGNDIVLGPYYSSQATFVDTPANLSNITTYSGPRVFYTRGSAGAGQAIALIDSDTPADAAKYIRNSGGSFQILNGAFSAAIFSLDDAGKITTALETTNSTIDDGSGNLQTGGSVQAGGTGIKLFNNGTLQFLTTGGSAFESGSGAPAAGLGSNGDFYFRSDGTAGSLIYHKAAGSWSAIA